MTLGYDPVKQRIVGSYIGSMMTHLWIYDGQLDPASRRLTLHTEGPGLTAEPATAHYEDTIELVSDDHRVLTSSVLRDDGSWHRFMTMHYRRVQ